MRHKPADANHTVCPSAQPDTPGSEIFGVVAGTDNNPRLAYLKEPQPVTEEVLALATPAPATEVFRFAASCVGSRCKHFDGRDCRLIKRAVPMLPPVVDKLPPCPLRANCRWWRQEGRAACLRCPLVVTGLKYPTDNDRRLADPDDYHTDTA